MFFVYEALLYLVFVLGFPWFLLVGFLRGKYLPNFWTRMGHYRTAAMPHDLWMHAVSVGEVLAARTVVDEIKRRRPETTMVVTTTTLTGQAMARRHFPGAEVTYVPFDFSFAVQRFLRHHRPVVFATMETEIWPNLTELSAREGVRLLLANGRISDRSFPRYRMFRPFLRRILARFDSILTREETDRERFVAIGAPAEKVSVAGNVKFDFEPTASEPEAEELVTRLAGGRKIFIAGSTMEGEPDLILPAIQKIVEEDGGFVVVAPRKPERFNVVAALFDTSSLRSRRRSDLTTLAAVDEASRSGVDVLVLDSIGELAGLYRHAQAAFIGGSLVPSGGHNPIEPAAVGTPVAFGPSMTNFREIASVLLEHGAAVEVRDAEELRSFVHEMFSDDASRLEMSERAVQIVRRSRGASARIAGRIVEMLG